MIRFDQVSKVYSGGFQALQKVSFHLQKGEMAYLTGHSGAGKSTLLKLISVMERPTDGRVYFNGQDVSRIRRGDIPYVRRRIGMIFQDHHLINGRTVFDNVALPLVIEGYGHQDIRRRVSAALDKVGLHGKDRYYPPMLSGGSSSGWALPGPSSTSPRCCWRTSPPVIWIRSCRWKYCICSRPSTGWG